METIALNFINTFFSFKKKGGDKKRMSVVKEDEEDFGIQIKASSTNSFPLETIPDDKS